MTAWARTVRVIGLSVALGLALACAASAAFLYTVDSTLDQLDDDTSDGVCHTVLGTCTLRAAVMQANKNTSADTTILLPGGIYDLTRLPILADGDDSGDLNLTAPVSGSPVIAISGSGAATTFIDAHQIDRVFQVDAGRTASISGVTLLDGSVTAEDTYGGGILNSGTLTVSSCTLTANGSVASGGGIYNNNGAALTLDRSTLKGNVAPNGGGLANSGASLDMKQSTISGNSADFGGGVFNSTLIYVTNSTISDNHSTGDGGGFYNIGTVWTYNATISFNLADSDHNTSGYGSGVYNANVGSFFLRDSIVAGNERGDPPLPEDCSGTVGVFGQNRFWTYSGCTVVPQNADGGSESIGSLAELGPLQFNGGSTRTIAIVAPSNMIDGGVACINLGAPAVDQRGGTRGTCDIGAFEFGALPANLIFADGFELGNLWAWG